MATIDESPVDGGARIHADADENAARAAIACRRHDLRIATIGNVDSGKSTLSRTSGCSYACTPTDDVGVLTRNVNDDGRGKARSFVFHHDHEKETGRSSSVSVEIMGFAGDAPVAVDVKAARAKLWQNVAAHSDRTISLIDLCGHERYLKTTIFGLTGLLPDYGMVVVGSNMGLARMTREHIGIAAALGLPVFVVVTKIDMSPPEVHRATMDDVNKTLKRARKMPFVVRSMANVETAARGILSERLTPVLCVSNVTGEGLDLLRALLRLVPPRVSTLAARGEAFKSHGDVGGALGAGMKPASAAAAAGTAAQPADTALRLTADSAAAPEKKSAAGGGGEGPTSPMGGAPRDEHAQVAQDAQPVAAGAGPCEGGGPGSTAGAPAPSSTPGETCVDSVFNVPGVGVVVAGTVMKGPIHAGSTMLLGPDRAGDFQPVTIRSIHVQYTPTDVALPGGSAAFAIRPKGRLKAGVDRRRPWVRKGMSLVHPDMAPASYWEFSAEVLVLHHQTTLTCGYAPVVHVGVVTQSACIIAIAGLDGAPVAALRTGDRAVITCRFQYRPEYIHPGDTLLFREGRAKGVGRIRGVAVPHSSGTSHASAGAAGASLSSATGSGAGGSSAAAE